MSVSLTSSGLYLEPRVYVGGSGTNYGTPKFVSSSTSLGGGSWSGCYNFQSGPSLGNLIIQAESNVSSSSGGVFTSEYPKTSLSKGKEVA